MNAPILLFVFNRPDHVRRTVEALQRNTLAAESILYIYSDAARTPEQKGAVSEVRRYIHTINGFKEINIIVREENWGLAKSIIDGVTTRVKEYGRVIVLEDDLITAPYFLQFMNDALETYKNEERVGHIQGCDFTQEPSLPDTFLIKWTGSWGWATWERAWKYFNPDGKALLKELEDRKLTYTFDFNGKYGYTRMLRRQIEGKNNSWAIRWNASLFLNDILSLNVGKSLVQNEGFDGSGTNCGGGGLYSSNLYMDKIEVKKITPTVENEEARMAYVKYYARTNSFMAKAIRRIKRTLKGDFGR
ncbi:glycosyltransferase [Bacteroides caecigallinarum]|uniref:glycosyltransferase n=1 Tax=Bacteroides caecigallinarum TaxID=1411144 RepID=UPI001F40038F|nr:glycosyltransferase [Bacteroides caecigallinarum]MCF2593951.1 glycosyltransferase [Bacteroides caecigallinarum]